MSRRHLVVRLDAPLMSFGGVTIDNFGVTDAWPSASLLVGLIGNALGCRRVDENALQNLQDRLVFACRADREGERLRDYQTADLKHADTGWTTRGRPEGRSGGATTYRGKHIRYRDFWADRIVIVAIRLDPTEHETELARVAEALHAPARPLFIGRKPCLPASPLFAGWSEGESALDAVSQVPVTNTPERLGRPINHGAVAPAHDPPHPFIEDRFREIWISGSRNWASDVHGGAERWLEGRLPTVARQPA